MSIEIVPAYNFQEEIRELLTEYTDMLIEGDSDIKNYLELQNYDEELEDLQTKYGLPYGRLYLAYSDKKPAGCIGLKRIDNKNCEVKRLYVRPAFRGRHIGRLLMEQIIREECSFICLLCRQTVNRAWFFPGLLSVQVLTQLMAACCQLFIGRNACHDKLPFFSSVYFIKSFHILYASL